MQIIEKVFKILLLDRKTTGERVLVVFVAAIMGIVLMIFLLHLEGKFYWDGKLNLKLVTTIHIFVLSVPTAWVLWVFRNEDKKIDHVNADKQETRYYKAIKADNIFKLIKIVVSDLTLILKE